MLRKKIGFVASLIIALIWVLPQVTPIANYIDETKIIRAANEQHAFWSTSDTVFQNMFSRTHSADKKEQLLTRIQALAKARYEAPVNAKIDPVWKAIPGYNGLEVDIDRTYKLALSRKQFNNPELLFREIEPEIQLDDLPPNPIYKGNPNKKMVSLMINVAWGNEYLEKMLKTLDEENVKATFFLDGSWLNKNVDLALAIKQKGHEISNHAYSHKDMSKYAEAIQRTEIQKTEQLLAEKLNVENTLFAPPSGDYNQTTVKLAHEMNLRTILWTLDTVDWKDPEPEWIVKKISTRLEPGSLILMHPTSSSSQALATLIREITNQGYAIGTVSDTLSSKRINAIETPFDF